MVIYNTLHFADVDWFHSISMLLVINHYFSLCSKISNIWSNIRCFIHMPDLSFIQLILSHTILLFLSGINYPFRHGRLNSSLDVVDHLSSYIVGQESLFINTLICQQFVEFCLPLSVAQGSSIVQVLVDSHTCWEKSTSLVNLRLAHVELVMSLIDLFRLHK